MDDDFDHIAFVVFEDETYRYGFNNDSLEIFDVETAEEVAEALCPRDDPDEVIIT